MRRTVRADRVQRTLTEEKSERLLNALDAAGTARAVSGLEQADGGEECASLDALARTANVGCLASASKSLACNRTEAANVLSWLVVFALLPHTRRPLFRWCVTRRPDQY